MTHITKTQLKYSMNTPLPELAEHPPPPPPGHAGSIPGLILCYSGALKHIFCTEGREFEKSNFKKFKFEVSAGGEGMLNFQIDRYFPIAFKV